MSITDYSCPGAEGDIGFDELNWWMINKRLHTPSDDPAPDNQDLGRGRPLKKTGSKLLEIVSAFNPSADIRNAFADKT